MNTITLADKQIDLDLSEEEAARRSIISACADRATDTINSIPTHKCQDCTHALLTSFFALEIFQKLAGEFPPGSELAIRLATVRELLHIAGLDIAFSIADAH